MRSITLLFMLISCDAEDVKVESDTTEVNTDLDGDGFTAEDGDCDDNNPAVNSSAVEICDGLDNNCDGEIDEGVTTTYYLDSDGDGFGDNDSIKSLPTDIRLDTNHRKCTIHTEILRRQQVCTLYRQSILETRIEFFIDHHRPVDFHTELIPCGCLTQMVYGSATVSS